MHMCAHWAENGYVTRIKKKKFLTLDLSEKKTKKKTKEGNSLRRQWKQEKTTNKHTCKNREDNTI